MINDCSKEVLFHIKDVQICRSEKDTLDEVLEMKTGDIPTSIMPEIERVDAELNRHIIHQSFETNVFDVEIDELK